MIINQVEETFTWDKKRNHEKGERYEKFAKYLLNSLRVCENIHNIPTSSNQIDYLVEVRPHKFTHPFLAGLGQYFLVECKNEKSSISSREVADLAGLMNDHKCNFGVFISRKDFAGLYKYEDANAKRYKEYQQSNKIIISLTFDNIKKLCEHKENLLTLIRDKHRLFITEQDLLKSKQ